MRARLPVRRFLIGQGDGAAGIGSAFGLAAHQHGDAGRQLGNLAILTGDDIRHILDLAGEVGQHFLDIRCAVHGAVLGCRPPKGQPRHLAPTPPLS